MRASRDMRYAAGRGGDALPRVKSPSACLVYGRESPLQEGINRPIAHGLAGELAQHNRDLLLMPLRSGTWEESGKLAGERVDGCFFVQPFETRIESMASGLSLPAVILNMRTMVQRPHVLFDDIEGGRMAAKHLAELGHRRLAYASPGHHHYSTTERMEGMRDVVGGTGGSVTYISCAGQGAFSCWRNLPASSRPSALALSSDELAAAFVRDARRAGVSVPRDVSILSFNGCGLCELCYPTLTAIRLPAATLAQRAVESLLRQLEGHMERETFSEVALKPELDVRESAGKAG